jgi:hypothetical protein
MSLNRTARGIVLVPSLLLGGAFFAAAAWNGAGAAADNRPLAIAIGAVLMGAGLLTQLLPVDRPEADGEPAGDGEGPQP